MATELSPRGITLKKEPQGTLKTHARRRRHLDDV